MASGYPNTKDSFSTAHVDPPAPGSPEIIHAAIVNDLADAVNKIEAALGILPQDVYADVAARLAALEILRFNGMTVTAYALALSDRTKVVVMTNAAACTLTIPTNATVPFPIGTEIVVRQGGAGQITIGGPGAVAGGTAGGVTVVNPFNSFVTAAQNAEVKLLKINTDAWSVNGEVA